MNQSVSSEKIIDQLTQQLNKTPRFNPAGIIGSAVTLFCLPLLAGFIFFIGIRNDWPITAITKPASFILLGMFCFLAVISLAKPMGKFPYKSLLLLPVIASSLLTLLSAPALSWTAAMQFETRGFCLLWISSLGTLIYFSLRFILHRARPHSAHLFGAILGCFSATLAASFYATHCPQDAFSYIVVSYLPALMIVTIIGAVLPHKRWSW